ncbi:MAG TPA: hypothetical protein DIS66_07320 [Candidatus Omnitrophica bacterium]|nr:hypothetical protein [Candidatus Omnitrophota bacterium]
MLKKFVSTTSFTVMWLFAFSLLSNCYCAPVEVTPSSQPVASHCKQHPNNSESKDSDCAPRYQADQFENISVAKKTAEAFVLSDIPTTEVVFVQAERETRFLKWAEPPPISSPHFFILHHAFLI